ncbi:alkylhydroperoxidase domain protein/CMD domain protein [Leucobacter exalbidus]|uniref:Alkylhydroperoxidase domain protein/CMD domain protein n=1 Tax=Leucobacter exalbidus TaxID=662960 RepID=A0A940PLR4_9MICO|nr:alkylhydroperoxidase domain protein [Leucobacter exalbidus]MBP1326242.1 alkylhydroperoxidase domain protein/CMD domain protein [Leucobacter exalbidus]
MTPTVAAELSVSERAASSFVPRTADVIAALAEITPGDARDLARARRPEASAHAQGSFEALFVPSDASQVSLVERAAVALFVARLHEQPVAVEFYGALLRETGGGPGVEPLIVAEAEAAAGQGPYGNFHAENAGESVAGPVYTVESVEAAYALGDHLSAALEYAHMLVLHPRDAGREHLKQLLEAGWSTTGIVTLSQLIAFLTFQFRVVEGLRVIAGQHQASGPAAASPELSQRLSALAGEVAVAASAAVAGEATGEVTVFETLPQAPKVVEPPRFTSDALGWKPWLEPLPAAEFTPQHHEALVEPERIHMPYFRLLARDPDALRERTLTDIDIFFNTDAGLPRAEREVAAAASSRFTGCVFCASVHARFGIEQGADAGIVQRLLDEGVTRFTAENTAEQPSFGPRWDAIIGATVALTATPPRLGEAEVAQLRAAGLEELELLDVVQAGSFFNWANRLMLSLGEPTV